MLQETELLKKFISIDSSRSTNRIADFVGTLLKERGYSVQEQVVDSDNKNVVATLGDSPRLVFSGHLDTVGYDSKEWLETVAVGPTTPLDRDGRIYGRGAVDMKAGLAAMLTAAINEPKEGLMLLLTADEEVGFKGIDRAVQELKNTDFNPELVVFAEPTDLKMINKHKGLVEVRYLVKGKSAHSSRPGDARDPKQLMRTLLDLEQEMEQEKYFDSEADYFPTLRITSGQFGAKAGLDMHEELISGYRNRVLLFDRNRFNTTPDVFEFNLDIRTTRQFEQAGGSSYVLDRILRASEKLGLHVEDINTVNSKKALDTSRARLGKVERAVQQVTGSAVYSSMTGYTEAGILTGDLGSPSVILGPGPASNAHQTPEYVTAESLILCTDIFEKIIGEYLK